METLLGYHQNRAAIQVPDNMRHAPRRALGRPVTVAFGIAVVVAIAWLSPSIVGAMHAADHRFNIEGYVCGPDGKPIADVTVTAKDARVDVRASAVTDSSGYYKAVLHLHNDNRGDPIAVYANDQEKKTTAVFDTKDLETDRGATVNFGSGCEKANQGPGPWVYYTIGIGLAMAVVLAGARLMKSKRKSPQKRKVKRKQVS
jgi:hypothetical protein